MQQHIHAIFKLKKKIEDGDKAGTYLCLSLLGVFPARFCSVFLQTKTMETQNRNEILSYILNKIDKDKTGTYRSLARVTFPSMNLLGFSAMVTIEGQIGEGLGFRSSFGKKKGQRGRRLLSN